MGPSPRRLALLVSQYLLILGILVMSFFPQLLIVPISQAIDPYFASTLVWEGMPLEEIYGYWNPVPAMAAAVAVSALLFGVLWMLWATRAEEHRCRGRTAPPPGVLRLLQASPDKAHTAFGLDLLECNCRRREGNGR